MYEFDASNYNPKDLILGVCFIKNNNNDNLTVVPSAKGNPFIRGNVFYAQNFYEEGMDQSQTLLGLPVNIVQSNLGLTKSAFNGLMKKSLSYYKNVSPFPFIGMLFTYTALSEIPGTDGRITIFPEDAQLLDIVSVKPYESSIIKKARRQATAQEVALDQIQRRSPGLMGTFKNLLGI